jgi:hypothetical protein
MRIPLGNGRGAAKTPKRRNDQGGAMAVRRSHSSRAASGAIGVAVDGDCTCRDSGHGTRVNEPSHGNASPRGTKIGSVLQRWLRASADDPAFCRSQSLLFFGKLRASQRAPRDSLLMHASVGLPSATHDETRSIGHK